jgi:hypothetical protein
LYCGSPVERTIVNVSGKVGRCFDRGHAGVVDIYCFHVMRVLNTIIFLITEIFHFYKAT